MKRFILMILATVSSVAIADETSLYLGAHIGHGNAKDKYSVTGSNGTAIIDDLRADGIEGGGFIGYQFDFEKTAFSVELDYSSAAVDAEVASPVLDYPATVGLNQLLSFTGKFAVPVTEAAAVFFRAGYIIGEFEGSAQTQGVSLSGSDEQGGFVVGAGMEMGLSENLSLYGEYQHQNFGDFLTTISGLRIKQEVYINTFRTGLRYQF